MAANVGNGVVVWEWQNEFGSWMPYDAHVTTFIESNKYSSSPLPLGSIDTKLYLYTLDLIGMFQNRLGTGTQRPIRRTLHPASSPISRGITWQWEGDVASRWFDYDPRVATLLEECHSKKQSFVDLTNTQFMLPYHIDLIGMTQIKVGTGWKRKIQRVFTSSSYPVDTTPMPSAASQSTSSNGKRKSVTNNRDVGKRLRSGASSTVTVQGSVSHSPSSVLIPGPYSTPVSVIQANNTVFATGFGTSSAPYSQVAAASSSSSGSSQSLTFPPIQGPVTRNKYNQAINALGQLSTTYNPPPSGPKIGGNYPAVFNPSGSTAFTNVSHTQASSASSATNLGNSILATPLASNSAGNISFSVSSGLTAAGVGASVPGFGPGSQLHTGSAGPSSLSAFQQPGHFNPFHLMPHAKGSRIRPAFPAQSTSSGAAAPSNGPMRIPSHARIPNNVPKGSKGAISHTADHILHNYVTTIFTAPADEDCCICCEKLVEASGQGKGTYEDRLVIQLEKCSHMFHRLCLNAMYESGSKDGSIQCPSCKTIYGQKLGTCPRGDMEYHIINTSLAGYEDCQTIQLAYHIPNGTQGAGHPFPGRRFTTRGFPRIGYLPDNDKGRKVLQLLIIAWKRRLTFTIGTSSTTGEDGTVVWNEIHHKTELGTNYSGHGYPDPNYLDNALLELAGHGITENDLDLAPS